jgi:hypothetical protein
MPHFSNILIFVGFMKAFSKNSLLCFERFNRPGTGEWRAYVNAVVRSVQTSKGTPYAELRLLPKWLDRPPF